MIGKWKAVRVGGYDPENPKPDPFLPDGIDRGQRFEVSVFDETQNHRIAVAWSDDAKVAGEAATATELNANWTYAWVTDRLALREAEGREGK